MKDLAGRAAARAILVTTISTIALCSASSAFAQDEANDEAGNNVIVVTAQFREQALQDTPLAITAVNAETMEAKNQTNLSQVADRAPNVTLRQQGGSFGPSVSVSIRGIGQGDFNPAYEPGVGIYIDDVYYPQLTGAMFDLLDLERVEILRGPQGTLAGRNSIGGAIKMFSKKPSGENGGYVEGTYGSRNKIGLRASADFGLTDEIAGRVSGVYKSQDGFVDILDFGCVNPVGSALNPAPGIAPLQSSGNCKVGEQGDQNYQAVRGTLSYDSSAMDLNVTLSGDYTREDRGNAPEVLNAISGLSTPNTDVNGIPLDSRFICGDFCNYATYQQPAGTWYWAPGVDSGIPVNGYTGVNRATYDGWNVTNQIHLGLTDRVSIDNIFGYGDFSATFDADDDLSPLPINAGHNRLTHWHWSEELRVNFNPVDPVTIVLGGYYFKQSTEYFSYQDIRYIPIPLQFQQPDVTDADSKAAFAALSWEIMPALNLNAGIRYTEEAKTYNYFRFNLDGTVNAFLDPIGAADGVGAPGALSGLAAQYSGNNTDYRLALDYRFSDALMVYASYTTGFKGGGTNPRPFYAQQAIGFGPETLTNYEIGFKSDFLDRRVRLNMSAFHSVYKDIQIGVSVCPVDPPFDTPCAASVNAGDGRYNGLEGELFVEPVDNFTIDGSFSYLDFKYTDLLPSAEYPTSVGGVVRDDPPFGTPKTKWNIGAQYRADLGNAGSITPRVDVEHTGEIYYGTDRISVPGERLRLFLPSVTLVNARLTWRNADEDLDISLEGRNLTDKYHFINVFDLRSAGAGFSKATLASPREIAISVKKKF